jgi:hypothetical protein
MRTLTRQLFHGAEAPFELGIGEPQRLLGIDRQVSCPVRHREQQVADFLGRGAPPVPAPLRRSSSSILSRTPAASGPVEAHAPARLPSFAARASAGSASGTSRASLGAARHAPRARAPCVLPRRDSVRRANDVRVGEHVRMPHGELVEMASATLAKSNQPRSAPICAWNTTWNSRSPSSDLDVAGARRGRSASATS